MEAMGEHYPDGHDATFASGGAPGIAPPHGRQLNVGNCPDDGFGPGPQQTTGTQAESGAYDDAACNPDPDLATLITADVQGFLNGGMDDEDEY